MPDDKHPWAPEPWEIQMKPNNFGSVSGKGERHIFHVGNHVAPEYVAIADAQRIVACANACAGVPTEDLPKLRDIKTKDVTKIIVLRDIKAGETLTIFDFKFEEAPNDQRPLSSD